MTKNRFITGYSGLRALAVIGVILYHLNPNTFVGGYLGVPIFFVLSGYLVTDHMFKAYREQGYYDQHKFYFGRIKKLYPPLIAVLWLSAAYIFLFQRNLLVKLAQIVVANLLNVYNFWQIINGQSYFERFATNESPFTHLWTMSINGQFYLLWPIVIYLLVKFAKKRKTTFWILFGVSLASALEMALLYHSGVDINRIYYGTDTRFFSLGLGAALAVIWPMEKLRTDVTITDTYILDGVGLVALAGLIWLFFSPQMDPEHSFTYNGGMLLFTVLTAILVGIIAHPSSHWNKWLTNPVFNWIGSRSYGIYLYQFPVMIFFEDKVTNVADHVFLYPLIEIALILVLSEISYRFIERPLGKITWVKLKNYCSQLFKKSTTNYFAKLQAIISCLVFLIGTAAILVSPTVKARDFNKSQLATRIRANQVQQKKDNQVLITKLQKAKKKTRQRTKLVNEAHRAAKSHPVNQSFEKYGISQVDLQLARKVQLTAIGDSVMAGSSDTLRQLMPKAVIDAAISRQLNAAFGLISQYQAQKALDNNVLIGLGTNGPFPMTDLDQLMKQVGPKTQVFWINTHVPSKPWQNQVNSLLETAAKKYRNLIIIDWYNYSKKHPSWFYQDNTHPTPVGSKYYSALIAKTIAKHARF
ncbi:acyltransferase family protein [Lactobacillus sp. ESL0731]|uniref:acyltransferase family protein n=1 Tax=unclassified Lactobacillus TaxID=2620435 RepID=UPI0023F68262|nr:MULTISPECIES: acyltransferase family protein [unclassified Lactobacillus]WEV51968.1 acyltransferase family protein [Lactobacillus sp. ESL0700]WEV63099.1 acyltransferase family protein [Lactobacillus sp. ESL0731]